MEATGKPRALEPRASATGALSEDNPTPFLRLDLLRRRSDALPDYGCPIHARSLIRVPKDRSLRRQYRVLALA